MNHRTSRGAYGRETGIIDLGHEPPLSVDGSEAAVIDRRRVSVQWFSGTILTGLCGAALIGGAVFASLDGEMTFAKVPERVEGALRGAFGAADRAATLHKSDRLPPPNESTASRNIVRVSTVARVGNRDVMRVRPFVRISGNLSMTTSDLSAKIPPFNAQRMLNDVGSSDTPNTDDANADAAFGSDPTSVRRRWALNGGIFADRSLVVIDRLPAIRMKGRTRITSRLPTRATVETRTMLREAVDSFGGGRRSLLCRVAARSAAPNAPRSAPSTRSGTLAKVISPSSEAKTAPPIRAAPQSPVRIVPLNHCTETRRRSMTAASEPSTDSGGSWPRSMIPVSRP